MAFYSAAQGEEPLHCQVPVDGMPCGSFSSLLLNIWLATECQATS